MHLLRIRHVMAGGRGGRFRKNNRPHEQLALLLARFGDWTKQPDLAEGRAEDIVIAYWNHIPGTAEPVQVSSEQVRKNYEVLRGPCALICFGNFARTVSLMDPELVGKLVALYVPAFTPAPVP